ncbi:BTAD domain-containing putative transcriptional regulator [Verrucosispora sp. NA02020]|uniref:AfsR/SARP family transcriptional regulator n=2 Tax=Micromonospora TaxID=1873 RepID=UPI002102313C|nr:BTAD domain-containing putative transcriptional regulator [Verrucosispora sp. SN26_14.1]
MEGEIFVVASAQARLLGPVTVATTDREVELGPPRQKSVFAVLAANANQRVNRDELIEAVWGSEPPATARNSVHTYVAGIRARLEPERPLRAPSELLIYNGSGYTLQFAPENIDQQYFEARLANAGRLRRMNSLHSAIGELDAGLESWRGTPYGGTVGPFAEAERLRLSEMRLIALEDRAELLLETRQYSQVMVHLLSLVRRHPTRERLRYLLMSCYVRMGRQPAALQEYHDIRAALAEEVGVEPGDRLQQLYEQILRRTGDGADGQPIGLPDDRVLVRLSTGPAPPMTGGQLDEPDGQSTTMAQLARTVPGFTGRAADLRQLNDVVSAAHSAGEAAVVALTGPPGVGKTALAVQFAHSLARQFDDGQLHIDLRGFAEEGSGPMSGGEALGHLLAALGAPSPGGDLERMSGLYRSLVAGRRMLILLDNAHSAEQVRPLLPGATSSLTIVTSRNRLTGLTVRDGARQLALGPLGESDAVELFGNMLGRPATLQRNRSAVRKVVHACGRLPLALRIAAARIAGSPAPDRALLEPVGTELLDRLEVPGDEHSSLRNVFGWSYRALAPEAAAMFVALGRSTTRTISLTTASAFAGTESYHARHALDALIDASLVEEMATDLFRLNPLIFAYARGLATAGDLESDPCRAPGCATRVRPQAIRDESLGGHSSSRPDGRATGRRPPR